MKSSEPSKFFPKEMTLWMESNYSNLISVMENTLFWMILSIFPLLSYLSEFILGSVGPWEFWKSDVEEHWLHCCHSGPLVSSKLMMPLLLTCCLNPNYKLRLITFFLFILNPTPLDHEDQGLWLKSEQSFMFDNLLVAHRLFNTYVGQQFQVLGYN